MVSIHVYYLKHEFVSIITSDNDSAPVGKRLPKWTVEFFEKQLRPLTGLPLSSPLHCLAYNFRNQCKPLPALLRSCQDFWGFLTPLPNGDFATNLLVNQEVLLWNADTPTESQQFHWSAPITQYETPSWVRWQFLSIPDSASSSGSNGTEAELHVVPLPDSEMRFLVGFRTWIEAARRWSPSKTLPAHGWLCVTIHSSEPPPLTSLETAPQPTPFSSLLQSSVSRALSELPLCALLLGTLCGLVHFWLTKWFLLT